MRAPSPILPALVTAGFFAAATPALADSDHCIFLSSINGFNAIDDHAVIVYTGVRKAYRIDVAGYCNGLRDTETLAIDSRDGRVCWPSNNYIVTSYGRCLVTSVLPMADAKQKEKPARD